jgi:hypothetical protein
MTPCGFEPRQYAALLMHVWLAVWRAGLGMSAGAFISTDGMDVQIAMSGGRIKLR